MDEGVLRVAEAIGKSTPDTVLALTREALASTKDDYPRLFRALCGLPAKASDDELAAEQAKARTNLNELFRAEGLLEEQEGTPLPERS